VSKVKSRRKSKRMSRRRRKPVSKVKSRRKSKRMSRRRRKPVSKGKSRRKSKRMSRRRKPCPFGRKVSGGCKKKSGPKKNQKIKKDKPVVSQRVRGGWRKNVPDRFRQATPKQLPQIKLEYPFIEDID